MRAEAHVHIGRARKGFKDCISVRPLPNGLTHHSSYLVMSDVTFAVQPAGLYRFRKTGQKNVHAYVRGTVHHDIADASLLAEGFVIPVREVTYNPMINGSFVDKATGEPVYSAEYVALVGKKVFTWEAQ